LNRLDGRPGNDAAVVVATKLLAQLVANRRLVDLFRPTIREILVKIVLPNLLMRETDLENFEDNPMEYIRGDIEGSNLETRSRAASELVRAMLREFGPETTSICQELMGTLVKEFVANPTGNWRQFDCAVSLIIALAVKYSTIQGGVSELNPGVDVQSFFTQFIVPVLTDTSGVAANAHPVVQADAIKFFSTFRVQMPREVVVQALPHLARRLQAPSFVVHTYAASCIERIFMIKEPVPEGSPYGTRPTLRYGTAELNPILGACLGNLFSILETTEYGISNEYVGKAVMRLLAKAEDAQIAQEAPALLSKMGAVLQRVCSNPQNPSFIHFLFESIAIIVGSTCRINPAACEQFEQQLNPSFQMVLVNEIGELTAYVFQIMAQLIELRPSGVSPGYLSLYKPLLKQSMWENRGNIPGLVRLIEAFLRKAANELVGPSPQELEPLLGIFQLLVSMKTTSEMGFRLLTGIIDFCNPAAYNPYLGKIIALTLQRISSYQNKQLAVSVVHFLAVYVGRNDAATLVAAFDSVQPGHAALFAQVLSQVWVPTTKNMKKKSDRKACVIALSKILAQVPALLEPPHQFAWASTLVAILHVLEMPPDASASRSNEDQLLEQEESGYSSSFIRLVYAQTEIRDSFKEIDDPKKFFISTLADACAARPGKYTPLIQGAVQDKASCTKAIQQYCQAYGKQLV